MLFGDRHAQAHRFQPRHEGAVVLQVPRVRRFQPLFPEHHQRLVQGVQVVDRRGVVVGALGAAAPVAHHQLHVEEPGLNLVLAGVDALHGALAEGDR